MARQNLKARIDKLKAMPAMRDMREYFSMTYECLKEADLSIGRPPGESMKKFEKAFVARNGTKEEFVNQKMEQWNRQHGRRRAEN